jgi:hypothetical protein
VDIVISPFVVNLMALFSRLEMTLPTLNCLLLQGYLLVYI